MAGRIGTYRPCIASHRHITREITTSRGVRVRVTRIMVLDVGYTRQAGEMPTLCTSDMAECIKITRALGYLDTCPA